MLLTVRRAESRPYERVKDSCPELCLLTEGSLFRLAEIQTALCVLP